MARFAHRLLKKSGFLWPLAGLSLVGYIVLALWFPLRPYFNHVPSPDVRSLAPTLLQALGYAAILSALFGLYWLAYREICKRQLKVTITQILIAGTLLCVPLLLTFPINATDVYRYFIFGRITSVYGQGPYETTVSEIDDESLRDLAGEWVSESSPYGPVWELTAAGLSSIVGHDLWLGLLLYKGLGALSHLVISWLIWLVLDKNKPARRAGLTLLWAWNPAILLMLVMDAHNDGLMLVWLLLGWWFMSRDRIQIGIIFMLLAPLTKPIALLVLPVFFVAGWRRLPKRQDKLRYLGTTMVAALLLPSIAFWPLGSPFPLVERLLSEAGTGLGFSPIALIILQSQHLGTNISIDSLQRMANILFGLLFLWLLWRTWTGRFPLRAAADLFYGYIVQALRFRIWYVTWPFAWLILDSGRSGKDDRAARARMIAGQTMLYTSQISVLIYGQIRTELFDRSHRHAHSVGIPMVFLLPLVTAAIAYFITKGQVGVGNDISTEANVGI